MNCTDFYVKGTYYGLYFGSNVPILVLLLPRKLLYRYKNDKKCEIMLRSKTNLHVLSQVIDVTVFCSDLNKA